MLPFLLCGTPGWQPCQNPLCWPFTPTLPALLRLVIAENPKPLASGSLSQVPVELTFPEAVLTPPGSLWHCIATQSSFLPALGSLVESLPLGFPHSPCSRAATLSLLGSAEALPTKLPASPFLIQ